MSLIGSRSDQLSTNGMLSRSAFIEPEHLPISDLVNAALAQKLDYKLWARQQLLNSASLLLDFENNRYVRDEGIEGWMTERPLTDLLTFSRAGSATGINRLGVLQEVGPDIPVFENSGLRLRPAETNLVWPSENFGSWNTQGATVSGAKESAPNNTETAEYLVPASNASGVAQVYKTFNVSPDTNYVVCAFGRADAYGRSYLQSNFGGSFATGTTHFDLSAGTVLAVNSALTAGIEALAGGWSLTWHSGKTGPSQTTLQVSVGCCPPGSLLGTGSTPGAVAGDGTSGIWIFGGVLALGTSPIPYIPTTSGAVTRAADNISIQGAAFASIYNPMEGAYIFDGDLALVDGWMHRIVSSDGTGVQLSTGKNGAVGIYGFVSGSPTNNAFTTSGHGASGKFGVTWNGTDAYLWARGVRYGPITVDMSQADRFLFATDTALKWHEYRRLAIFPYRPTDQQMEILTS